MVRGAPVISVNDAAACQPSRRHSLGLGLGLGPGPITEYT